jgi:hypothetical protein
MWKLTIITCVKMSMSENRQIQNLIDYLFFDTRPSFQQIKKKRKRKKNQTSSHKPMWKQNWNELNLTNP